MRKPLGHARKADHRLYAYVHVVNLTTGLRRKEMLGLRWQAPDLDHHQLQVRQTCTYITGKAHFGPPKTHAARRTLALDEETVQVLRDLMGAKGATVRDEQRRATALAVDHLYKAILEDVSPGTAGHDQDTPDENKEDAI